MLKNKVEGKIKALKKLPAKTKLVIAVGILGILLIFLSEMFPANSKTDSKVTPTESTASDDTDSYKEQIEKELKNVLSQVRGVGECEVMVTVEGTTEYVYAENLTKSTDNNGDRTSDRYENEIVMTDNDGKKEALVRKIIKPQICGVVIVCEGGGDIKVNERVLKAVSTALGISSSKICVEGKK
ncbi:stage III sporulation protein AG [uncultured Ruminococcus sp.]|uniref:stage III sporulation protein AG n=1 Tax=uncultured Ruminococcus sp. TaxID=165186 RepID=UPI0025F546E5|nr:stage III sporulation protein AG [uncultured Ruminococcus sp.]